jgi:hypothetical protein
MGLTTLELEIADVASPEVTEKLEFLIDFGAMLVGRYFESK